MHYSIISAAGNFTISKRTIILDPNITTFRDFVSKQIGDGDITIDDQIENTSGKIKKAPCAIHMELNLQSKKQLHIFL